MRVLYFAEWYGHGATVPFIRLGCFISQLGHEVYLGTSGCEAQPGVLNLTGYENSHIQILPETLGSKSYLISGIREIRDLLTRLEIDIVHCQTIRELVIVAAASVIVKHRPALVFTDHYSLTWDSIWRAILKIAALIVSRSQYIALSTQQFKKILKIPFLRLRVWNVPNGIVLSEFMYVERTNESWIPTLIYPATFRPTKGHLELLEMCATLRGRGRDVLLFLVGDGPEKDAVEQRSVELGLEDQVRFLGRISQQELMRKMAEADIGVFPSYREMMPYSVLEMMATGLPVVAYETGGVADSLESGRSGYLVPIGNKEIFLNWLTYLLDHPLETRTMGKAARERVEKHFSLEAVAHKLIEVYEHAVRNGDNE